MLLHVIIQIAQIQCLLTISIFHNKLKRQQQQILLKILKLLMDQHKVDQHKVAQHK